MTEREWLSEDDVYRLLDCVRQSERKNSLFCLACFERVRKFCVFGESGALAQVAAGYIEGKMTLQDVQAATTRLYEAIDTSPVPKGTEDEGEYRMYRYWVDKSATKIASNGPDAHAAAEVAINLSPEFVPASYAQKREERALVAIVRDIFGNPYRPVVTNPAWLTSDVVNLAKAIYDEQAFDRMVKLADSLKQVGCDQPDILAHCTGKGPHVRGCWVIDLLLGKN